MTVREKLRKAIDGKGTTHISIKKHRSKFVLVFGILLTFLMIIASICIGPTKILNPLEGLSAALSAISKGGNDLSNNEFLIYHTRLPRTMTALAVGMGLSVAGAVYQAIIRNPMVDPYIMGVSSGAGTAAIAVLAFQFTFFGLFSLTSPYTTAMVAIIGGMIAYAMTMILAERAGGSTNSYVLSGVIVGLIFGAIQTILMVFAGNHLSNVMLWLFGSFSSVTWDKVWIILISSTAICLFTLKWAKELNLILLGEQQAKQMGLDAHRFSMFMLTLASVLTSICVAFCGIIGFVGLIIPHLCRMLFGGDYRLVLSGSIFFGIGLMIAADILARMAMIGYELPVGAITTIIGVPVFAYLLIKKGKMYNG